MRCSVRTFWFWSWTPTWSSWMCLQSHLSPWLARVCLVRWGFFGGVWDRTRGMDGIVVKLMVKLCSSCAACNVIVSWKGERYGIKAHENTWKTWCYRDVRGRGGESCGLMFLLNWLSKPVWCGANSWCARSKPALPLQRALAESTQVCSRQPHCSGGCCRRILRHRRQNVTLNICNYKVQ